MITTAQAILRHHFKRMWPNRHNPNTRSAVRDNLAGQRAAKRHAAEHPEMHVWVPEER